MGDKAITYQTDESERSDSEKSKHSGTSWSYGTIVVDSSLYGTRHISGHFTENDKPGKSSSGSGGGDHGIS